MQTRLPAAMAPSLFLLVPIVLASMADCCSGGGGPENIFLVVNPTSIDSMTVANHYVHLRQVPPQNIFYLPFKRPKTQTVGSVFRDEILKPIFEEIKSRELSGQIDYLVYSCDYPWRVNFQKDYPEEKFPRQLLPVASLTGASYLWPMSAGKRKELFSLANNFYFSKVRNGLTLSRGFHGSVFWSSDGRMTTREKGIPYLLSSMIGVTDGRGNSVPEIVRYLNSAADADGTKPKGTIYYVKNDGPRSTPRHDDFSKAVADLKLLGVHAEVVTGQFIKNKAQVMGVTSGAPRLNIATSGCRFLPGAFGDNLTSAGGNLVIRKTKAPAQTALSEFLRFGCAGSCGTVVEPMNFPQKFPSAFIHVHYARGCSLAEAFYQSVSGPYQQLLVGDPLCQPWANLVDLKLKDIEAGQRVSGSLEVEPVIEGEGAPRMKSYELYLDGVRKQRKRPGENFLLNTEELADGYHQLRIVATDATPIETQSRWVGEVLVKNGLDALQLSSDIKVVPTQTKSFTVNVACTQSEPVSIYHNGRELTTISDGNGEALIMVDKVGRGPITLIAESKGDTPLRSRPLELLLP